MKQPTKEELLELYQAKEMLDKIVDKLRDIADNATGAGYYDEEFHEKLVETGNFDDCIEGGLDIGRAELAYELLKMHDG